MTDRLPVTAKAATPHRQRIKPARLRDLPSVLDISQVANVLRVSRRSVYGYVAAGELRRLRYSRVFLFDAREIERFLERETGPEEGAAS